MAEGVTAFFQQPLLKFHAFYNRPAKIKDLFVPDSQIHFDTQMRYLN
jgi:hypothetical protein